MIVEPSAIVARDMGVRRGGRWLLRPAAFGIAEGVTGLTGPPGVGKTSVLATFATLRRPYTGTLEILGYDTEDSRNLRAIRARLGYLPDNFEWAANLNVRDFVAYVAYYKRAPQAAIDAMLARMELDDVASMELGVLPPDVRLRAGLAATCVHEPDLVLLDDPCGGLEESVQAELMPLIRSLAPTVLLTAPAAQQLTGWCDRVLSLVRGRLTGLADGTAPATPAVPTSSPASAPTAPATPATPAAPPLSRLPYGSYEPPESCGAYGSSGRYEPYGRRYTPYEPDGPSVADPHDPTDLTDKPDPADTAAAEDRRADREPDRMRPVPSQVPAGSGARG